MNVPLEFLVATIVCVIITSRIASEIIFFLIFYDERKINFPIKGSLFYSVGYLVFSPWISDQNKYHLNVQ